MRAGVESQEARGPAGYEPPAVRSLGLVDELTAGPDSQDSLVKTVTVSD